MRFNPHERRLPVDGPCVEETLLALSGIALWRRNDSLQRHGCPFIEPAREPQVGQTVMRQFMRNSIGCGSFVTPWHRDVGEAPWNANAAACRLDALLEVIGEVLVVIILFRED